MKKRKITTIVASVLLLITVPFCIHHKKKDIALFLLPLLSQQQTAPSVVAPENIPPTNVCNADMFKDVDVLNGGKNTIKINSKIVIAQPTTMKAFMEGWNFAAGSFYLAINNKTPGRYYLLTAYGLYDLPDHKCDVYLQRWGTDLLPVENFNFTNFGTVMVDSTDVSLPKSSGGYYNFSKTYIQFIVFDSDGKDVTDTDGATVTINSTE